MDCYGVMRLYSDPQREQELYVLLWHKVDVGVHKVCPLLAVLFVLFVTEYIATEHWTMSNLRASELNLALLLML